MQSRATTVQQYLKSLPADRRAALEALRKVILANMDGDIEEGMQYGMIGYYVPHSRYPNGYHCDPRQPLPFAGLGSQKNHMSLYMMCTYGNEANESWFREAWTKTGKKLDMGKACVRFKKLEDVPLEVVGKAFKRMTVKKYIAHYESAVMSPSSKRKQAKSAKPAAKKATKKAAAKKPARKASARKATKKTAARAKKA